MDLFSWYKIASLPVTPSDVKTILVIMCPKGICTSVLKEHSECNKRPVSGTRCLFVW